MATTVHPTAVVDATVELADGVVVGAHAVIDRDVTIDTGTEVGAGAHIQGPTRIGRDNRIYSGACVGFDPQDLKFAGEKTWLEVGDRNQIREFCTLHRGTGKGGSLTKVGDDNLLMAYTHIAHDCVVGHRTIFANNATLAGHVTVADDATVGAFSSVHQFCRIGRHAYIGGYSVITRDALPFVKTVGMKPLCYGINRIGLERKGFSPEILKVLDAAYRILVRSRLATEHALERLRGELGEHAEVMEWIEFMKASSRGVIRDLPGRKGGRGGRDDG